LAVADAVKDTDEEVTEDDEGKTDVADVVFEIERLVASHPDTRHKDNMSPTAACIFFIFLAPFNHHSKHILLLCYHG
jgi:hypothetical protein